MQVDGTQEDVELGVSVYPAERQQPMLNLCLEQGHLVRHVAVVGVAFLLRDDQVRDQKAVWLLAAAQKSASLHLTCGIRVCKLQELYDDVQRASDLL